MRKMKGLSKELKTTNGHRQQYGDYQRKGGRSLVEEGKGGINGDRRRLDLGW